jgi:hypothetical protein
VEMSSFVEDVPNRSGYQCYVISHEERRPCHSVLQGEFPSYFIFPVEVDFVLDQKILRTGQI